MTTVTQSKSRNAYLRRVLRQGPRSLVEALLYRVPHNSPKEDVCLKLGRYSVSAKGRKQGFEIEQPKSVVWLRRDELAVLLDFLQENYEPFKRGASKYVSFDGSIDDDAVEAIKILLANKDKQRVLSMLANTDIMPQHIFDSLQHSKRVKSVETFEEMLTQDLPERRWQTWLKANSWVLGTEYVKILDERAFDVDSESDYLLQAYDGFLDIVEIKRPGGGLHFWADKIDRGNYYPSTELTKAIIQSIQYIADAERRTNDHAFIQRVGGVKVVKPRCVLLFGRSIDWDVTQREAYRVLNSSFHNLTILTYDHVLDRARRMLDIDGVERQMTMEMSPQEVDFLTCPY